MRNLKNADTVLSDSSNLGVSEHARSVPVSGPSVLMSDVLYFLWRTSPLQSPVAAMCPGSSRLKASALSGDLLSSPLSSHMLTQPAISSA